MASEASEATRVDRRPPTVLLTLVVAYASFYLCRANVESAFPLLRTAFGYSKAELGLLSSVPIAFYAAGKVLTGALGEVLGGKRLLLLGMMGSIAATFAFGASSSLAAFIACASVNRLFQSGGWSGAVGVVAARFDRPRHGGVMGVLSTSYLAGDVVAIHLCALVASLLPGWRWLFVLNPLVFAAVAAYVAGALPAPEPRAPTELALPGAPSSPVGLGPILSMLAARPAFWMAVALSVLLTFLRVSFVTWTATYLFELSRVTGPTAVSGAIAKSSIFPAAGIVAALVIGALSDRYGPGRRAPVMAFSLAVVCVLVLVLAHAGVQSPAVAALLIGGVGLFLFGPYSLPSGAMALDVSNVKGASVAAGIIDGAGYFGATVSGVALGRIADVRGWPAVFDVIAAATFAATCLTGVWAAAVLRRRA
jgi:OPA family glycerol-3-phosphate transporter-like MFS transporter